MPWFDQFHQLVEEQIIEISSDSEEGNEQTDDIILIESDYEYDSNERGQLSEANQEAQNAVNALKARLCQIVPVYLIGQDILERVWSISQQLLHDAIDQGASIDDVHIDQGGLISWPGRAWDPDCETLHSVLQKRLEEHEASEELGFVVRDIVVRLGNQRLDEARSLDVTLGKLYVDNDLLPYWRSESLDSPLSEPSDDLIRERFTPTSNEIIGDAYVETDVDMEEALATGLMRDGEECRPLASLSSSLLSSYEADSDRDVAFDDVVSLRNFVEDSSSVEDFESDDLADPPNVVHDVDIVGAGGDMSLDFELYLAQENEDLDEMLEIEMAIDRDGFEEFYHQAHEGVDLAVDERDIFCSVPETNENEEVEEADIESGQIIVDEEEPVDSSDWMYI